MFIIMHALELHSQSFIFYFPELILNSVFFFDKDQNMQKYRLKSRNSSLVCSLLGTELLAIFLPYHDKIIEKVLQK